MTLTNSQAQTPLQRAHSHNDYEQKRPLFEALARGICSVEADIWLVNGKLLVAHGLPLKITRIFTTKKTKVPEL